MYVIYVANNNVTDSVRKKLRRHLEGASGLMVKICDNIELPTFDARTR